MYRQVQRALIALAAGLLFASGELVATTITSTSYTEWKLGLTGSPTELDFSPITNGKSYSTAVGITLKALGNSSIGFGFTGPDNGSYKLTGYFYGTRNIQSLEAGSDSTATVNVATPAGGDNALFLSLATTNSTPVSLTLSDGESFSITTAFFGLSISHPITWLTLTTTSGSAVIVDDFYYGASELSQDSPVSEGATGALCGGGMLVLLGSLRRKYPRQQP